MDNLVEAERDLGADSGGGESRANFHFTPFQEDEDGMFVWAQHVVDGWGHGNPDGSDGVLVPLGGGVQVHGSD